MAITSWVITNKQTGKAIAETFNPKVAAAINTAKYRAVPIGEWLANLNLSNSTPLED